MRGRKGLVAALAATAVVGAFGVGTLVAGMGSDPVPIRQSAPNTAGQGTRDTKGGRDYLVFYAPGKKAEAAQAVTAAGGAVTLDDAKLGYLVVRQVPATFPAKAGASPAVVGISPNRRIGAVGSLTHAPTALRDGPRLYAPILTAPGQSPATTDGSVATGVVAKGSGVDGAAAGRGGRAGAPEPLAGRQWDMKMIGATSSDSYAHAPGSHKVLVGIMDTGVDGRHPDIAPNFNRALSRNFVVDIPTDSKGKQIDGPCDYKSCVDPIDVDNDGHGTHVASTVGSPVNGLGMAGVAPGVSLVSLRAGQDSGYFFLKPTLDALTYAGDTGIDVVNMSYYVDPWLFNCARNPSDSRTDQLEQAGVVIGVQRALDYARRRGVTLISALGNEAVDLGTVKDDPTSPDYPKDAVRDRKVDDTCLSVPTESNGVISVSALGPSGHKAIYSDYGVEQTDLAAPGGDSNDDQGDVPADARQVLAAAPENALRADGRIQADGRSTDPSVIRDCHGGVCAYYQYLEGTSMAAPHATGVAAILVSRFGRPSKDGLTMDPAAVERLLYDTATHHACPSPRAYRYPGDEVHVCDGTADQNGFYGHGIVSAARAATISP
jgi:subtilisin family serine protease